MSGRLGYFGIVTSKRVVSEMSDPAIKLFGKTIALPSHGDQAGGGGGGGGGGGDEDKGFTNNKEIPTETNDKEQESANSEDESNVPITATTATSTADHETHQQKPPQSDDDGQDEDPMTEQEQQQQQQQQNDAQDQKPALKKPDKILPCPRCNSMDTKFCYYNNYNVNQPRHFCKNCQRYWTAGGTMRNVPVGAGRRKNKNAAAAAHYRHLTMADAAALQAITPDTILHPALKPNGTVLSFGSDTPLCESMSSVLSLAEKTMNNCSRSRFHRIEEHVEEQSTGSSAISSNSADHEGNGTNLQEPAGVQNCQGFAHHLPYINGSSPWSYPWNLLPPPPPGAAPFCGSSFPIPIYPAAAYWGCSAWSIPWLAPMQDSPSPSTASPGSGSNSSTLGKHTREGNVLHRGSSTDGVNKQSNQEKCLWIPKTLRIDDPEEAAKSSIWATMGFSKYDKADGISSRGGELFKSFQTKAELSSHGVEASQALHANPAALSRSINFQESS